MTNATRAYVFALLTVLSWSTSATAFKLSLRYIDLIQLIFYSCVASAAVLLAALWFRGDISKLPQTLRDHWRISLVSALLNPFAYYLILFGAYDRLPAQVAQPINYTWAMVLTFLSIVVLRQKMTWRDIAAALVCYTGVVIIVGQGRWIPLDVDHPVGIALALGSTVIWASYWIINMRDPREPAVALCVNFLIAVPLTFLLCVTQSNLSIPVRGAMGAIWVGLFEMGLAFLFWSHALRLATNTSRVSNLIFLSPFLSLVLIHYILGEGIYLTTWVGLGVIVSGLALQQWRTRLTPPVVN